MQKLKDMNTIKINADIYHEAKNYARLNNISIQDVIEKGMKTFFENMRASKPRHETIDMQKALQYVSTLSVKGSATVPADEDGREARSSKYL